MILNSLAKVTLVVSKGAGIGTQAVPVRSLQTALSQQLADIETTGG